MKRLTERDAFGNADIIGVDSEELQINLDLAELNRVTVALNKLAAYEDLEEQGRLLKLPCKFGDTVFVKRQTGGYTKAEVVDFSHILSCGFCIVVSSDEFGKCNIAFSQFGKTVFLHNPDADKVN